MGVRKFILLTVADLVILLLLLLLLAYYGLSHIFIIVLGAILLFLSAYDNRHGRLSAVLGLFLALPDPPEKTWLNWLPVALSLALVLYGLPQLLAHGPIDWVQRRAMQEGLFLKFSLWASAVTALIITAAVCSILRSYRK